MSVDSTPKIISFIQKRWGLLLALLCLVTIVPYIATCLYIHPFFDDYLFSAMIERNGKAFFCDYYYFKWTGRYTDIVLWALFNCKIGASNIQYVLFGLFLFISLFSSFLYLVYILFKDVYSFTQSILIALVAFSFYLVFMPELFSAFYWYDSSFYQLDLAVVLLNIAFVVDIFKEPKTWKYLFTILLNVYIGGVSEIYVITLGFLYLMIIIHQYARYKKFKNFWLLLLIIFGILSVLNIFSPGNMVRMQASHPMNSFFFSSIRAFYDYLMFHISYTCFKTPFLFLLLLFIPSAAKFVQLPTSTNKIFNIHPLYSILATLFIFYLHHALSVYGAGYSLQGRVIDFSILLFWMACFYNVLVVLKYFSAKNIFQKFEFNSLAIKISVIGIVLLFNVSDNNRLLWGDLLRELPLFNKQLNQRYTMIHQAKERGENTIEVPLITAMPKLYMLGDDAKCGTYNFVNDQHYLNEASGYFKISIKKQGE